MQAVNQNVIKNATKITIKHANENRTAIGNVRKIRQHVSPSGPN